MTNTEVTFDLNLIRNKASVQPVMYEKYHRRYSIDVGIGVIYDLVNETAIVPTLIDDKLMVVLCDDSGIEHEFALGDILINNIYGYTNSSFRPKLTEFPCNTANLRPKIHHLNEIDDNRLEINGVLYHRWLDSEYFVSDYGTVFSVPYGAFLRRHFTDRGYFAIHTKEDGINRSFRVHRLVWESNHGVIPADLELDHINNIRWDNRISNLQLLTHLQNLQKIAPDKYRKYSDEEIIAIARDISLGMHTSEISKKHDIAEDKVWDIKYRGVHASLIREAGIDISNVERDRKTSITNKDIPEILQMREDGIPVADIANKYNASLSFIYSIIRKKGF